MTMFVNRLQRNRVRLLSLALLLAAAGALVWVAVTALNDESAPSTPLVADNVLGNAPDAPVVGGQGGSGSVPLALTDVMDGLVRTGDAVSLAEGIYTGGSLLGAVYFSFESVADVITLYEETMAAENWRLVSLSGPELTEPNDKADSQTFMKAVFTKDSTTVSITAVTDAVKDPASGTTRVGIGIDDKSLALD